MTRPLTIVSFFLLAAPVCGPAADGTSLPAARAGLTAAPRPLTKEQKERLARALEPLHAKYDPAERMLKDKFSSPGYHTTLKGGDIHSTRAALTYAVACLDTGEDDLRVRAEQILDRVIRLQDQDPSSKTYGIWSWFLEEPLDKMSPPDWNWADFCGTALLQVALEHRDRITPELMRRIDESIRHAARSIRKRNVGPGYTNIAIMGTYVTLTAAELYGDQDLRQYAVERWRRFCEHTRHHGGFTEYNSPTYTIVALKELARLLRHAKNEEVRRSTQEIYELAWEDIARHFHAPTRQWAGPHSRCYRTLLGRDVLALITRATNGRVDFGTDTPSIDEPRLDLSCPERFDSFFTALRAPREFRQTFVNDRNPVIGTTYLHPLFCIGSVNRGDFWNQRRPVLAYAGTAEAPSYLRVRVLHDGYDFAAAQFFGAQQQGAVLGAITFATDGGDTHVSLDRIKNGTFRAKDVRLRFEVGGAVSDRLLKPPKDAGDSAYLPLGGVHARVSVPYARWGDSGGRWEGGRDKESAWLDLVLYAGDSKEIRFSELSQAAVGFVLSVSPDEAREALRPEARVTDGRLELSLGTNRVSTLVRPAPLASLR